MNNITRLSSSLSQIFHGKVNITMTSHSTNPNVAQINQNGQVMRPKLWQEIKSYELYTPELIQNHNSSEATKYLNQISIWFDFDRHQDDRTGIIIYMHLMNIQAILRWYNQYSFDCAKAIDQISHIVQTLQARFNNDETITIEELENFRVLLSKISTQINHLNLPLNGIVNPLGFNAHYRISSQYLYSPKDQLKIAQRLQELKLIKEEFGKLPISEIIIADCESVEDIAILRRLCKDSGIDQEIPIVPLIETDFGDRFLRDIVSQDITKVMLAGSYTIQRDTYITALLMKLKIQLQILQDKDKREIIFFEGTGSTVNRNGNMFRSRMGTIIEGIQYERTIQGKQRQEFMTDKSYHIRTLKDLAQGQRCSIENAKTAIPVLSRIYKEVSIYQIVQQKQPHFSQKYNKKTVYELLVNNSHMGSRCIKPKDSNSFTIKSQRAIPQSYLNLITGFHPELLFWDHLTDKTKDLIKENIGNRVIQDMLNQYTAISGMSCTKAAKNYLTCKSTLQKFTMGRNALRVFLDEIKNSPIEESAKEGLLLFKSREQIVKNAFNLEDYDTEKVWSAYEKFDQKRVKGAECFKEEISRSMLFQRTGAGFSTLKSSYMADLREIEISFTKNKLQSMELKKVLSWI